MLPVLLHIPLLDTLVVLNRRFIRFLLATDSSARLELAGRSCRLYLPIHAVDYYFVTHGPFRTLLEPKCRGLLHLVLLRELPTVTFSRIRPIA